LRYSILQWQRGRHASGISAGESGNDEIVRAVLERLNAEREQPSA
jgi:4-hydroxy-3-methylbut-2-enyl diphosphate reductase IspH